MLVLVLTGTALLTYMYKVATSDPLVRTAVVPVAGLSGPVRLVLVSDIHVAGPDMPPSRLERLVLRINQLNPDLVLIAGDFVSDKRTSSRGYSVTEATAPLANLKANFGIAAVLGNHDHWRDADATREQLRRHGIRLLENDAQRMGPVTVIGLDDPFTGKDNLPLALRAQRAEPPPYILLSHSPDIFPSVPRNISLMLAGHTHCGQIRLPLLGAVSTMSEFGERYACGKIDERGRTLIVSAGLGTSVLPLRLGAVPDMWLVELVPATNDREQP